VNGNAILTCNSGFADANSNPADGCEVNLMTDPKNCGTVGNDVSNVPHGVGACVNGMAQIGSCLPGYYDVNGVVNDGCESTTPPCAINHSNGLGQTYTDCQPLGTPGNAATYTLVMAQEAANAFLAGHTGQVSTGTCGIANAVIVTGPASSEVWAYSGPLAGLVLETSGGPPFCPATGDPTWN
jgi:hypothetical protein